MKLFSVLVLSLFFVRLNARITIRMDDGDFLQVSDFLQVFAHGPIRPYEHSFYLRNGRKIAHALGQMFGITASLVAANLLTAHFTPSPSITSVQQETKMEICYGANATVDSDGFKNEFGCHKNACWRSCYSVDENKANYWCFSSPVLSNREFKNCTYHSDCAPYWECLESCHGKYKIFH